VPTYQYACTECGHAFEQFQSFSDDALTVCPRCEGRLRKLFNAVGVVFKGSGFYRTDSRTDGEKKSAAGAANGSSGSDGSGKEPSGAGSEKGSGTATPVGSAAGSSAGSSSGGSSAD
jgi:putative FmdB family regulatory protein